MRDDLAGRLLAAAHIVGPLLLFLGSCAFLAGQQGWEGVLGFYGMVALTPVLLWLPRRFSETSPRLAAVCHVLAALGCAAATLGMAMRSVYVALSRAGLVTGTLQEAFVPLLMADQNPEMMVIGISGLVFPLALTLEGIGLWRTELEHRTAGPLLVASGLLFVLAQGAGVAQSITYPACFVCMLGSLAPLAWPELRR